MNALTVIFSWFYRPIYKLFFRYFFYRFKDWIKSNGNSSIFLIWLYSQGTKFMYLQYSRPFIYHLLKMFGRRRILSAGPSLLMFRIDRLISRISSSLVLYRVPGSGSFTLAKRS